MKSRATQKGFSELPLLIGVAVAVAIALAGWYVIRTSQNPPLKPAAKSVANSPEAGKPQTAASNYLAIGEWDVRFNLPDTLQNDVIYGIRKNVRLNDYAPDDPPVYGEVAYFASKTLNNTIATPNTCGLRPGAQDDLHGRPDPASYEGGPGIALARSTEELPGARRIGDTWYEVRRSAVACYKDSDGTREKAFVGRIADALAKLEPVPSR